MKTTRIIATITILGAFSFYIFGVPYLLLPEDFLFDELPKRAQVMISLWIAGYDLIGMQGAGYLLKHIWKS